MTTERKTISNRRNSQRSTGPRTSAGKARSSLNAFKNGLRARKIVVLPSEYEDTRKFVAKAWADLAPVGVAEETIADLFIRESIRISRAYYIEIGLLYHSFSSGRVENLLDSAIADVCGEAAKRAVSIGDLVGADPTLSRASRAVAELFGSGLGGSNEERFSGTATPRQKRRSIEGNGGPKPDLYSRGCPIRIVTPEDTDDSELSVVVKNFERKDESLARLQASLSRGINQVRKLLRELERLQQARNRTLQSASDAF